MKTTARYLLYLFTILTLSCGKDIPNSPDNNTIQEIDIDINENKYYDDEIFPEQFTGIYDKWRLNSISGSYTGAGYAPDFEKLVVQKIGIFKFYRNDSLLN